VAIKSTLEKHFLSVVTLHVIMCQSLKIGYNLEHIFRLYYYIYNGTDFSRY